jgi:methionine--tRNA ligase beta chain
MVTIDKFQELDIRIVKILEASRIENSEKLLKLTVDIGNETRQILAGIGKSYAPEDLIDRTVVAIVNLEPRMMMGEESQGMILATGDEIENISLLMSEKKVEPGARIR